MPKVYILKSDEKEDVLCISNKEWCNAVKEMNKCEFSLYLYLASFLNNDSVILKQKDFETATGFRKSAYHEAIKKLKELGYLIEQGFGELSFYSTPIRDSGKLESVKRYFGDVPKH